MAGIVNFTYNAEYNNPKMSSDASVRIYGLIEKLIESGAPNSMTEPTTNWPVITRVICRDGTFVIEASDETCAIRLNFNPSDPHPGDYSIQYKVSRRPDSGSIDKADLLGEDLNSYRLRMLSRFPTRFRLVSRSSTPPHAKMIWRIGIEDYKAFTDIE